MSQLWESLKAGWLAVPEQARFWLVVMLCIMAVLAGIAYVDDRRRARE